jgi:hypothetical protein
MFDLKTIKRMNAATGLSAQRTKPFQLTNKEQLAAMPPFPFPSVGDRSHDYDKQYERLASLFCDLGWGGVGPALSAAGIVRRLGELFDEHGPLLLAVEEEGQFQCYVGAWKEQA